MYNHLLLYTVFVVSPTATFSERQLTDTPCVVNHSTLLFLERLLLPVDLPMLHFCDPIPIFQDDSKVLQLVKNNGLF